MTLKDAKAKAKEYGFTLNRKDGEYRICRIGFPEEFAYYTTDLADAIGTAKYNHDRVSLS